MIEENNFRIREIFSVLTQGVEMNQYDGKIGSKNTVHKILVWIDSDMYRICADVIRPTVAERAKGKISPGVYLRDISGVREGSNTPEFQASKTIPDATKCLAIIGTERTISLELPSKFTRDWFLVRFRLLADDILVQQEKQSRKYRIQDSFKSSARTFEMPIANNMETLLTRGIQLLHHKSYGVIEKSVLKYDFKTNKFLLIPHAKTNQKPASEISLPDLSEIRPGSHSIGFVRTECTMLDNETLSLVSSSEVMDLQFINRTARDLFAEHLFHFVIFMRSKLIREESINFTMLGVQDIDVENQDDDVQLSSSLASEMEVRNPNNHNSL